jgi:hypothetical protein
MTLSVSNKSPYLTVYIKDDLFPSSVSFHTFYIHIIKNMSDDQTRLRRQEDAIQRKEKVQDVTSNLQ